MKRAFTLIELLAVIIILAIVALIATPIVINVVNSAKESARKSQLSLYADSIKLQLTESYFKNNGKYNPRINLDDDNLDSSITCKDVHYTKEDKILLEDCTVKGHNGNFWYVDGNVSSQKPENFDFLKENPISTSNIVIPEYVDSSGANKPKLYYNMIPALYENNNWVYADIYEKWYDYDLKEWANAIVLNDGVTKEVGDIINIDTDVALMFVWIPRYKYTIFNAHNGSVSPRTIILEFEKDIEQTGTVICNNAVTGAGTTSETCSDITNSGIKNDISTYTHPVFCLGRRANGVCDGDEGTGIWVGKFENSAPNVTSNTIQKIVIKPNVQSWRVYPGKINIYNSAINLASNYSVNFDSHLMKNTEWGAVAYLSQSKYGRCDNGSCSIISKNDSSSFYTGRSQGTASPTSANSANGTYTYELPLGQLASTTGNIYGIYDMSGGQWDYVMGNMVDENKQFYVNNSGFLFPPENEFYDSYTYDTSIMTYSRGKLGDATKETLKLYESDSGGWYGDYAVFPQNPYPWFMRGGVGNYTTTFGIFSFHWGGGTSEYTTRAVLTVNDN